MATIIQVQNPHWSAGSGWVRELASYLPATWLVNAGGEVIDRDPSDVAALVSGGGTWVDYCGYPMYYREECLGSGPCGVAKLGENGFREFLVAAGNLLFDHTFRSDHEGFEFPRSLVLRDGLPSWVIPATELIHTDKIYAAFMVKHPSGGRYLYAYGVNGAGVTPSAYAQFISRVTGVEPPPVYPPGPGTGLGLLIVVGMGLLAYWGLNKRG